MSRPPLNSVKERTTCDICGEPLTIPPGVIYRGKRMHKQEAQRLALQDFGLEVRAPELAEVEAGLREALREE